MPGSGSGRSPRRLFGNADIGSLLALRAIGDVEGYTLIFSQRAEALGLNCGEMGEKVFTAAVRRNKAKTLGVIEPLDDTSCHV